MSIKPSEVNIPTQQDNELIDKLEPLIDGALRDFDSKRGSKCMTLNDIDKSLSSYEKLTIPQLGELQSRYPDWSVTQHQVDALLEWPVGRYYLKFEPKTLSV